MNGRVLSALLVLSLSCAAMAGELTVQTVGEPGAWVNTLVAAATGADLYTIETSGGLYVTDPASGSWKMIGKPEFGNTLLLFTVDDLLVSIEKNGSLYLINPATGAWKQSGASGEWGGTIAGAMLDGTLYTVEKAGDLYATDPKAGTWRKVGNPDFADTVFLLAAGNRLVSIEKSGALYAINPADGSWKALGEAGAWADTTAGAVVRGVLYTSDKSGGLFATDLSNGARAPAGSLASGGAKFLFGVSGALCGIDGAGSLFRTAGGESAAVAAEPAPQATSASSSPADDEAKNDPARAGALTFKFLGKWKGDTAPFEKEPDFQEQMKAAPEMMKGLVEMMQGMTMAVTLDGVSMTVMGETAGPFKYSVIAGYDDTLVIENDEGPKKGVRSRIIFTDDKHIQVIEVNNEGKAMYFVKE